MAADHPSLWALVDRRAGAAPDGLFAVDEHGRSLTFAGYRDEALAVAAGLAGLGVGDGTPVSWLLPTWIETLVLIGALARLGAVQNPIIPLYREREVRFCTEQTGARVLVVPATWRGVDHESMARSVAAAQPDLDVVVVDPASGRHLPRGGAEALGGVPEPRGEGVRWHFYTSGTTAVPKGVRHTDATLTAAAVGVNRSVELSEADRMAVVFPYAHVGGVGLLAGAMVAGYAQVLVESFDPATSIPFLSEQDVTVAGAGTVFWQAYLDAQQARPGTRLFPYLRALVGGGSAKLPGLHDRVRDELGGRGTVSGYGLTECPSAVLGSIHDPDAKLASTDGRPVEGASLRVVDAGGRVCAAGEEGEIRLRGPMCFVGYVDPALDADAFDGEGWLRTGDLGTVDGDGYLTVTGRLKDVVIRKGENISTAEVESVLATHPAVREVAVVGLPDPSRGELLCAVVVAADPASPPAFAELVDHCRAEGLATYKLPERIEVVPALPHNATGKVPKHDVRRLVEGLAGLGPAPEAR